MCWILYNITHLGCDKLVDYWSEGKHTSVYEVLYSACKISVWWNVIIVQWNRTTIVKVWVSKWKSDSIENITTCSSIILIWSKIAIRIVPLDSIVHNHILLGQLKNKEIKIQLDTGAVWQSIESLEFTFRWHQKSRRATRCMPLASRKDSMKKKFRCQPVGSSSSLYFLNDEKRQRKCVMDK